MGSGMGRRWIQWCRVKYATGGLSAKSGGRGGEGQTCCQDEDSEG